MRYWNVTEAEKAATFPCQAYVERGQVYLRAVDVDADPATVFRWVCQLKVAPYSYDWIDNVGRRSPRSLTPGVDRLEVGEWFMEIFQLLEHTDTSLTMKMGSKGSRWFGDVVLTYLVERTPTGSRLVAAMTLAADGRLAQLRRWALGWGDLVMMRKQLRTLKKLAEQTTPVG